MHPNKHEPTSEYKSSSDSKPQTLKRSQSYLDAKNDNLKSGSINDLKSSKLNKLEDQKQG